MKLNTPSTKRTLVDKANSTVILAVSIAAVLVTFSLVASKALWDQRGFQSRVITKKSVALSQLKANISATDTLVASYQAFVSSPENAIGGNPVGEGERDGDNARIVLDALPSKYDFPALATSVYKILNDQGFAVSSINGTDEQVTQSASVDASSPVEIPFSFSVETNFDGSKLLFDKLQKSIRPFNVRVISLSSSNDSSVAVTVDAKTYYLPESGVDITLEEVK